MVFQSVGRFGFLTDSMDTKIPKSMGKCANKLKGEVDCKHKGRNYDNKNENKEQPTAAAAATLRDYLEVTKMNKYLEHDGFEPQIPSNISWFCVWTGHIYLLVGTALLFCKQPLLIILGLHNYFLYVTTILHWQKPLFQSFLHYLDLFAVIEVTLYSTYALYNTSSLVFIIWMFNITLAFCIFLVNEFLYYYQVRVPKDILKADPTFKISVAEPIDDEYRLSLKYSIDRYFNLEPSWPNTEERVYSYYRSTITHGLCVHGLTGGVAGLSVAIICLTQYQ